MLSTDVFLSHNWGPDEHGRNNHSRVILINDALKSLGYKTWFDGERMVGDMVTQMSEGIDNTKAVIVFLTQKYHDKVNGKNERDNCKLEFMYSTRRKTASRMIPVIMDSSMKETSLWKGAIGMHLGGKMFINMSEVFEIPNYLHLQMQLLSKELKAIDIEPDDAGTKQHGDVIPKEIMHKTGDKSYLVNNQSSNDSNNDSEEMLKQSYDLKEKKSVDSHAEADEIQSIINLPFNQYCSRLSDKVDIDNRYYFTVLHFLLSGNSEEYELKAHFIYNKIGVLPCLHFFIEKHKLDKVQEILDNDSSYWNLEEWFAIFDIDLPSEIEVISKYIVDSQIISKSTVRFLVVHSCLDALKTFPVKKVNTIYSKDSKLILYCLYFNFPELLKHLLANGANTNYNDKTNGSLLHIGIMLMPSIVPDLFPYCKHQSFLTTTEHGNSPLHLCVNDSYITIAKLLINEGVDVNAENLIGCTPLHSILKPGKVLDSTNSKIYSLLIAKGGDISKTNHLGYFPGDHSVKCTIPLKIVMAGNSAVGKTCLGMSYRGSVFNSNVNSTIGVDFCTKSVNIGDNLKFKIQLWDTAGQEKFLPLTFTYFRNAHFLIVVVDLANIESILFVSNLIKDLSDKGIFLPIALVGNKLDLVEKREISDSKLKALKSSIG